MSYRKASNYRPQVRNVVFATGFFLVVAVALTAMMMHVIVTMRDRTNAIDDARASQAAAAAVDAFKSRLSLTMRDNAVWDDAFTAVTNGTIADWGYSNWGSTTTDYELYDAAIVTDPGGKPIMSYLKGRRFDPSRFFGPEFDRQVRFAIVPNLAPAANFYRVGDAIYLVVSQAIQPYKEADRKPGIYDVLTFAKQLDDMKVANIAHEYKLDGLRLTERLSRDELATVIKDSTGREIAYLEMPSQRPGSRVYSEMNGYIVSSVALLGLFLAAVLLAGNLEARRLARHTQRALFDATHDSLSGLQNRRGVLEFLGESLASEGRQPALTLFLIDLDGFKAINDAWGHAVGDQVIRIVAGKLNGCDPQIIGAGRLGGDEFALIHKGDLPAEEIGARILSLFAEPIDVDGRICEVGASIGYVRSDSGLDALELMRRADMALYRAKESGRGRVVAYTSDLDSERELVGQLESKLREAIAGDGIDVAYQPLFNATSNQIQGVEALARWQTEAGPVSPAVFIPLAEKSGLIDQLGLLVMKKAIAAAAAWPDLSISVNVSPIQLCNPNFVTTVMDVLRQSGFEPKRLILEVTEGVLISNPDLARRSIYALKAKGIRFALDDFGCGYASIGALREFGFDCMKIDRSLVHAAGDNENDRALLRATISLAVALRIPVTAEGIENADQALLVRNAGCDTLQGYLLGKPMTPAQITGIISEPGAQQLRA